MTHPPSKASALSTPPREMALVPAARVRTLPEALADPQKLANGSGHVTSPSRPTGADTEAFLGELGYDLQAIGKL